MDFGAVQRSEENNGEGQKKMARTSCDICFRSYSSTKWSRQPVVGNCGHSFCKSCAEQLRGKCARCRASFQPKKNYALIESLEQMEQLKMTVRSMRENLKKAGLPVDDVVEESEESGEEEEEPMEEETADAEEGEDEEEEEEAVDEEGAEEDDDDEDDDDLEEAEESDEESDSDEDHDESFEEAPVDDEDPEMEIIEIIEPRDVIIILDDSHAEADGEYESDDEPENQHEFEDIDDETVMSMLDFTNCKVVAHEVIDGSNYYKMRFHQGAVELLVEEKTVVEKAPGEMLSYFTGKNSKQEPGQVAAAAPSVQ